MILTPAMSRFVLHWGEMGTRWGVNRTVAQIHALLFVSGQALHADEICETLAIARSNVSTSLRELQGWSLVRLVHVASDRRDHYETTGQVWELMRIVVRERQRREIAPTIAALRELVAEPPAPDEPPGARKRMNETLELLQALTAWSEEMLKLDSKTLGQIVKLGARVQKLLGRAAPVAAAGAADARSNKSRPAAKEPTP